VPRGDSTELAEVLPRGKKPVGCSKEVCPLGRRARVNIPPWKGRGVDFGVISATLIVVNAGEGIMLTARTYEFLTKKVSVTKLSGKGNTSKVSIRGLEYAPPAHGEPYTVYTGDAKTFKTAPVRDVRETYCAVLIRTDNSIYQIKYLDQRD
jgi:hypothetical protein